MKTLFQVIFYAAFTLGFEIDVFSQKQVKQMVEANRANLVPFDYDCYAATKIQFEDKSQVVGIEFTAFEGRKYRIVFCTAGFEEPLNLTIYDKSSSLRYRRKVYDNQQELEKTFWTFEPPKSGTYYIDYGVPASINKKGKTGYVILLIGTADENGISYNYLHPPDEKNK